jgi:hypothetical protein
MRILFIGDIVGRPGREVIRNLLPEIKEKEEVEVVIANGENSAGGSGLTVRIVDDLISYGVDCITTGDHVWSKKDILNIIDQEPRLLRPANYPKGVVGKGSVVFPTKRGDLIGVINLLGRVFMEPIDSPFQVAIEEIEKLKEKTSIIIVDFHAEATSEKQAMGYFLDGKVSCVLGTHTHVQTADERILPNGTAYISDVGMTGPFKSVLGRNIDAVLKKFLTSTPTRFNVSDEDLRLQGVVVEIDKKEGKAIDIKRIEYKFA